MFKTLFPLLRILQRYSCLWVSTLLGCVCCMVGYLPQGQIALMEKQTTPKLQNENLFFPYDFFIFIDFLFQVTAVLKSFQQTDKYSGVVVSFCIHRLI